MPNLDTTYDTTNSITVVNSGIYEINYVLYVSASLATSITTAVRKNGTNIPSTVISRLLTIGLITEYNGSVIITLSSGDKIDLAISALLALTATLGSGVNAQLTIKQIG